MLTTSVLASWRTAVFKTSVPYAVGVMFSVPIPGIEA
jgi:hypothetical protein